MISNEFKCFILLLCVVVIYFYNYLLLLLLLYLLEFFSIYFRKKKYLKCCMYAYIHREREQKIYLLKKRFSRVNNNKLQSKIIQITKFVFISLLLFVNAGSGCFCLFLCCTLTLFLSLYSKAEVACLRCLQPSLVKFN